MPLGNIGHSQWDKVGLTSVRCRAGVRGVLGCSKMTLQWGSTCRRSWDSRFSVVWLKAKQSGGVRWCIMAQSLTLESHTAADTETALK